MGFHEGTDALSEVTDLDADIPQEGADCPLSHDYDFLRVHFGQIDFHGNLWLNGVGAHLSVWESQFLFANAKCAWPQGLSCHLRCDCCFLKLYPDRVHWCVICCSWVWVQSDDEFRPDVHGEEGCGQPTLCHCGVLTRFSVCWMSGTPFLPYGVSHCRVKFCGILCKNVYPLSEGCLCICPLL